MASIVLKDLAMDKELDNVSLLQILGGHRCFPPRRICVRRRVRYLKLRVYLQRKVTYVRRFKFVPAYKTITVCFWR